MEKPGRRRSALLAFHVQRSKETWSSLEHTQVITEFEIVKTIEVTLGRQSQLEHLEKVSLIKLFSSQLEKDSLIPQKLVG